MKDYLNILIILLIGLILFTNISENKIYKNQKIIEEKEKEKEKENLLNDDKKNLENNLDYVLVNNIKHRDEQVLLNPLIAPQKRVEQHQYTKLKLYEHTRGDPENFHLVGILYNEDINKTYQLFGRKTYPGSSLFEYYYRGRDSGGLDFKFPLNRNQELYDGDTIVVPTDKNIFTVKIYKNDYPRYNPYV